MSHPHPELRPEVTGPLVPRPNDRRVAYVGIGNSDDRLKQKEWASFCDETFVMLSDLAEEVHGQWFSAADSPYQNACMCIVYDPYDEDEIKEQLRGLAIRFRQDSIAWVPAAVTEFLR